MKANVKFRGLHLSDKYVEDIHDSLVKLNTTIEANTKAMKKNTEMTALMLAKYNRSAWQRIKDFFSMRVW